MSYLCRIPEGSRADPQRQRLFRRPCSFPVSVSSGSLARGVGGASVITTGERSHDLSSRSFLSHLEIHHEKSQADQCRYHHKYVPPSRAEVESVYRTINLIADLLAETPITSRLDYSL